MTRAGRIRWDAPSSQLPGPRSRARRHPQEAGGCLAVASDVGGREECTWRCSGSTARWRWSPAAASAIGLACCRGAGRGGGEGRHRRPRRGGRRGGPRRAEGEGPRPRDRDHGRHRFRPRHRGRRRRRRPPRQDRHPGQQCRHRPQRDAGRDGHRRALAERHRRQPERHLLVLPRLRQPHARGEVRSRSSISARCRASSSTSRRSRPSTTPPRPACTT